MDLLDRDLSEVQLSVTHKRLDELHPADVADILEQLDPQQRANVFKHLDMNQASEAISEMEDEYQAEFIDDLPDAQASVMLAKMDPDEAADIVRDLSYEKAETLLRLMGVEEAAEIRGLLGFKDGTAGGMMTTQFVQVHEEDTVHDTIELLRALPEDHPSIHHVYVCDEYDKLVGVASLRTLVLAPESKHMHDVMFDEVISITPDTTEDDVVETIFKYNLPALPVVNEDGSILGIVTTDDAWDAVEDDAIEKKFKPIVVVGIVLGVLAFIALYTVILLQLLHYPWS